MPTQKLKSWFLGFSSQEIGSTLISLEMIFVGLWSQLFRFKFHILSSKMLKIPWFNLNMWYVLWYSPCDISHMIWARYADKVKKSFSYGFNRFIFFKSYKGSFDIFRFTKKNIFIFIWTRRRKHLFNHYLYQVNVIDLFLLSIDSLTTIWSTDRSCPLSPDT